MTAMGISSAKTKSQKGFMSILASAACEWFLIFLLFLDAAFSYLLKKFAIYCELQTPCPLCSRIDHVFEESKPGYLRSLFCSNHKQEISTLVCCDNHGKLADIHAMCEDCIMSFSRRRKPNSESYGLHVGKMGVDVQDSGLRILLLSKGFVPDSSGPRTCSCCNMIFRAKTNTRRLPQVKIGYGASKANAKPPLPRIPSRSRFSRRENLKKLRDKFVGPVTPRTAASTAADALCHVGYTELKITSDSESEFPFSDDDDVTFAFRGKNDFNVEFQQGSQKLPVVDNDESGPLKQTHQTSESVTSLLDQTVQIESIECSSKNSSAPGSFVQHGLEEINWSHPNPKPNPSALTKLISLDDASQSAEDAKSSAFLAPPSNLAILSELLSLKNVLAPIVVDVSEKSSGITASNDAGNASVANHTTITEASDDNCPSVPNNLNSDDQLALRQSERRASGILAETLTISNFGKPEENPLSRSLSPGTDPSSKNATPRIHDYHDGLQRSDTSIGSEPIDMMQMAAAVARHDSGHESTDGISVKEMEGETVLDRLKRQVEYDRGCMRALFKELEEERSAAAVAANQAMAMITRLQEEKASLHMEALQYLRMMEEQAEYDMEALEKANDLLAEKEKEAQDLEAELEIYKNKFSGNHVSDDQGTSDTKGDEWTADKYEAAHIESSSNDTDLPKGINISESVCISKQGNGPASNFEDEKLYISECLKKLELKLHELSMNGTLTNLSNGGYSAKVTIEVDNQEGLVTDKGSQSDHPEGENGFPMHSDLTLLNGSREKEKSAGLVGENHPVMQSDFPANHQHKLSAHGGELILDTFRSEIADLKDRVEALKADGDILTHALNTLQNGSDGLQFIQEIAHQLQELRKFEFKKRCLSIP